MEKVILQRGDHVRLMSADLGRSFSGHKGVVSFNNWDSKEPKIQINNTYFGRHSVQTFYLDKPVITNTCFFDIKSTKKIQAQLKNVFGTRESIVFIDYSSDDNDKQLAYVTFSARYNWVQVIHCVTSTRRAAFTHHANIKMLKKLSTRYTLLRQFIMSNNTADLYKSLKIDKKHKEFILKELKDFDIVLSRPREEDLMFDLAKVC